MRFAYVDEVALKVAEADLPQSEIELVVVDTNRNRIVRPRGTLQ